MKLFVFIMLSLFFIQSCAAQSELPVGMPEKITVYWNQTGGMSRSYTKIRIDEGILEFEELKGGKTPQKWTAAVSREDLAALYKIFVENKFDTIKNDKREGIVYDAGSESISISLNKLKSFGVTYGKNSPLSGKNLERYQTVKNALGKLIEKYQNDRRKTAGDAENFIQGTWRAAGGDGVRAWFLDWTFADGAFKQIGYPPILQEGKYRVVSSDADRITLELFEQTGTFGTENSELEILVDKPANQLSISGTKVFLRIEPKEIN